MDKNNEIFNDTVGSLFHGMDSFLSTKTVVGEPIHIDDTIILPLVDVTFGLGAGTFRGDHKNNRGGGIGGKMRPSAVLIIHNGTTRMISVDHNRGIDKILDMIPDFVDKFSAKMGAADQDQDARKKAAEEMEDMLDHAVNDAKAD